MPSVRTTLLACVPAAAATAAFLLASPAEAAPGRPDPFTLEQPDGERFRAQVVGDEWGNRTETRGGHTVLRGAGGWWRYAERAPGGMLRATGDRVGEAVPAGPRHLEPAGPERSAAERREERARAASLTVSPADRAEAARYATTASAAVTGTQPTLVILARFADQASKGTTAAQWSSTMFGTGKTVTDYYKKASHGALTIGKATETHGTASDGVVGWLSLPMNHPNTKTSNTNSRLATRAAILAADPYVNYAQYDTDGDGTLTPSELHIVVVAAGQEASYGTTYTSKVVWAHRWQLFGTEIPSVDGVAVGGNGYTQVGEMHGTHRSTMGIIAHELGHDLGLPDLYDTDNSSYGLGDWSLMAYGSWNKLSTEDWEGLTPALLDAWSRTELGWITPTVVGTPTGTFSLPRAGSTASGAALQLGHNPAGTGWGSSATVGEYFLVENRYRASGSYDQGLPGSGMLVLHVDETRANNATDTRRLVDVEEADGLRELDLKKDYGDVGDLFRGGAKTSFNGGTNPNAKLYDGTVYGTAFSTISASGSTMTGRFVYTPVARAENAFASARAVTHATDLAVDSRAATTETGEPTVAGCPMGRTTWYSFTPTHDVRAQAFTSGSTGDPVIAAWQGTSLSSLTNIVCNDDYRPTDHKEAWTREFIARAGQRYYVQLGDWNDASAAALGTSSALHVRMRPVNDDFSAAYALSGESGSVGASNLGATWQSGEPLHGGSPLGDSVWWSWTAPTTRTVTVETVGSAAAVNTVLGVYTGAAVNALSLVGQNDDISSTVDDSRVTFTAQAGTTYRIAVDSKAGTAPGTLKLAWR